MVVVVMLLLLLPLVLLMVWLMGFHWCRPDLLDNVCRELVVGRGEAAELVDGQQCGDELNDIRVKGLFGVFGPTLTAR